MREVFEMMSSGQLQFRAEIISHNGEPSSMAVSHASITQSGLTTVLLDEKITLSTNSTSRDRTENSFAMISIPADGFSPGVIRTIGNASVSNNAFATKIGLAGGVKKLKATSESGLFVVARISLQRDANIHFFDLIFGQRGQSESVDSSGHKQRPHIAFYPDGNGKFLRLAGHIAF